MVTLKLTSILSYFLAFLIRMGGVFVVIISVIFILGLPLIILSLIHSQLLIVFRDNVWFDIFAVIISLCYYIVLFWEYRTPMESPSKELNRLIESIKK